MAKIKFNIFLFIIKLIIILLALALVVIPVTLGLVMFLNSAPADYITKEKLSNTEGITIAQDGGYFIEVRRGESAHLVGVRLERAGLIKNRYFWNLLCRLEKEHVKTGTYKIDMPKSQLAILRTLIAGRQILYKVTIPEGVTLSKTAMILENAGICPAIDFLSAARDISIINYYGIPVNSNNATMEGYLFPDTYLFPKDFPASKTVRTMADNFFKKLENISPTFRGLSLKELNEKVILASIIEREYRIKDEAPLMAGVFYNRLKLNMALQSCATVEYIITEIQGKPHPKVLLFSDLEIRNPYNTYILTGLPPGPISAPGTIALRSVMYPEKTDFLYFRLTDASSGKHYFSKTYDEHIRAGELFIKP